MLSWQHLVAARLERQWVYEDEDENVHSGLPQNYLDQEVSRKLNEDKTGDDASYDNCAVTSEVDGED